MKKVHPLLVITKIVAIVIIVAYGIGLYGTYGPLQAGVMFVIAIFMGLELVFMAKQATGSGE